MKDKHPLLRLLFALVKSISRPNLLYQVAICLEFFTHLAKASDIDGDDTAGVLVAVPAVAVTSLGVFVFKRLSNPTQFYKVWYGTNRAYKEFFYYTPRKTSYWKYVSEMSDSLQVGTCTVSVPKSHKFGSVGSPGAYRLFTRIFTGLDDKLVLTQTKPMSLERFHDALRQELRRQASEKKSCLLYVHGFNVSFEEAAIRAAQIGFDLKVPGVTAFFSWPSHAKGISHYAADEDQIAASEEDLLKFILELNRSLDGSCINVLAHSMGNRGLIRALHTATKQAELSGVKFGQIFLAAPDIEVRLFRRLSEIYSRIAARTTLYLSKADRALDISARVHVNQRTGYAPPVLVLPGIDTVEVSQIDLGLLGHSYYGEASAVLYDMFTLIRTNLGPEERPSLYPESEPSGGKYWTIRKRTG